MPLALLLLTAIAFVGGCSRVTSHQYTSRWGEVIIPQEGGKYTPVSEKDRLRGELNRYKTCYDINFYDLNIQVSPDDRFLKGYVVFHAVTLAETDTIQFDLYENMVISRITGGRDEEIPFYRKYNSVFAILPEMNINEKFILRVEYSGKPVVAKRAPWDGGFVWTKDENGNPWVAVACEGDGASLWWPNKDHPSEEPDSMAINITVPQGLVAVSNGRLSGITPLGNDLVTYRWFVRNPINNYNVTLNVGDYVTVQDTVVNNSGIHNIDHYVLSYHQDVAGRYFTRARDVIHVLEKYFGEYPWWDDGYKLVEAPYRGMEHQSAIAYGNGFKSGEYYYIYDLTDYIILHETAHEWWGNNITACDGADVWLHEAFASYSEILYIEDKSHPLISVDYLMGKRKRIRNEFPMAGPQGVNYWGFDDVYWKGAWILHTLRSVIDDDELFMGILKGFQTRFSKQIVCSEDFIQFVNEMTDSDYSYFFKQYLYDRRPPVFRYSVENEELKYRWEGVVPGFDMPMDIRLNGERLRLYPHENLQTMRIPEHSIVEILDKYFYVAIKDLDS